MRKKYQRKLNYKMRRLNKNIERDELWRGRFVFLQKDSYWQKFEDGSGGELILFIRAYDKKTGYYHDYRLVYAPWILTFNWNLTMEVGNTFIVKDLDVWRNEELPKGRSAIDYTHVKVNVEKLMTQPWNFYVDAEHFEKWRTENLQP